MQLLKKNSELQIKLTAALAYFLLNLIGRLVRIRYLGQEYPQKLDAENLPYILTLWHGRMFIPIFVQRKKGIVAMVSQHADGEFIARAIHKMGYRTVRGSSTRGGGKALREMVTLIKNGAIGAMLVDGPKGPPGEFKIGTLILAQLTGAPLIPMTYACSKPIVFNSWDKFVLAKPFSKAVVAYGEPFKIPRHLNDDELEKLRLEITQQMNSLVELAEENVRRWK